MEQPILNLPLDSVGDQLTHKFVEDHKVEKDNVYLVYPSRGPFYTSLITVKDQDGNTLKPELDWKPILHYRQASLELGQSVHRCLVIEKNGVTDVEIEYQAVGGIYTNSNIAFEQLLEWFLTEKEKVLWDDVIKPEKFKPTLHKHVVSTDLLGTQDLVAAINNVATVIIDWLNGKDFVIDDIVELREYLNKLDNKDATMEAAIQQLGVNLNQLEQRLNTTDGEVTKVNQRVDATNNVNVTQGQAINKNAQDISAANSAINSNSQSIATLDSLLKQTRKELGDLDDNFNQSDYAVVSVPGSDEQITRTRRTTYIDKLNGVTATLNIDMDSFLLNDTIVVNVPVIRDDYTTTVRVKDTGLFRDLEGRDSDSFYMDGNFQLEMRCIGKIGQNTVFQMIKLS